MYIMCSNNFAYAKKGSKTMYMSPINYQPMVNSNVNFQANSSTVKKAAEGVSKSGVFQAAVDKLASLQSEIEYGCSLLRLNNWFNPANVSESDKAIYELYQSKLANLQQQKKEVIDGMLKQVKQNEKYKNLSDDCMEHIREHIHCGSTWGGFYFNEESINKIIAGMK